MVMRYYNQIHGKVFIRVLYFIVTVLYIFFCLFMLSGCSLLKMSETRAAKKIASVEQKQPAVLYNYCATKFPPLIIDSTHTEYIKGQTAWRYDTVMVDCDSVLRGNSPQKGSKTTYSGKNRGGIPLFIRIPCPPCPISVDTFKYYKFLAQENGAKVSALTIERDNAKQDVAVLSAKVASKNKWLWILGAFAAVMVVWKVANWLKWVGV